MACIFSVISFFAILCDTRSIQFFQLLAPVISFCMHDRNVVPHSKRNILRTAKSKREEKDLHACTVCVNRCTIGVVITACYFCSFLHEFLSLTSYCFFRPFSVLLVQCVFTHTHNKPNPQTVTACHPIPSLL